MLKSHSIAVFPQDFILVAVEKLLTQHGTSDMQTYVMTHPKYTAANQARWLPKLDKTPSVPGRHFVV